MKNVKIFRAGNLIASADFDDPTDWIAQGQAGNWWGKPERWVRAGDEDVSQALETKQVVDELTAEAHTEYKLAAEYTITIDPIDDLIAENTRKEGVRTTRKARVIDLAKKFKAGTITATERNELIGLITLHLIREFGADLD